MPAGTIPAAKWKRRASHRQKLARWTWKDPATLDLIFVEEKTLVERVYRQAIGGQLSR
jgi:hypothetical protein